MKIGGVALQGFRRNRGNDSLDAFQGPSWGQEIRSIEPALLQLPVVYVCITRIVSKLRSLPRRVLNSKGEPMEGKPSWLHWLENPNPFMSGGDLISAVTASLLLDGNAYVFPIRDGSGRVSMVGVANPDAVQHYSSGSEIVWRVGGRVFKGEFYHMKHVSMPGRIEGLKRVEPLKRTMGISYESLRYTQQHLARGGAYQIALTIPPNVRSGVLTQKLNAAIKQFHRGWRNAYNPLILDGGVEVKELNPKLLNADGGFLDLQNITDARIAVAFGLDPLEIGIGVPGLSMTYRNEPSRQYKLYVDAIKPIATLIEEGLSQLLPPGYTLDLDQSEMLLGGPHDRTVMARNLTLVNKDMGQVIFTPEEIRRIAGFTDMPKEGEIKPLKQPEPVSKTQPKSKEKEGGND